MYEEDDTKFDDAGTGNLNINDLIPSGLVREDQVKQIATSFYEGIKADDEHPDFRALFKFESTPIPIAVANQYSYLCQKFGGDEFTGGMRKDTKMILDIHKQFVITPSYLVIWMDHFKRALNSTDLRDDVKDCILRWAGMFGRATVNKK